MKSLGLSPVSRLRPRCGNTPMTSCYVGEIGGAQHPADTSPAEAWGFADGDVAVGTTVIVNERQLFRVSRYSPEGERFWDRARGWQEGQGIALAFTQADNADVLVAGQLADDQGTPKPFVMRLTP